MEAYLTTIWPSATVELFLIGPWNSGDGPHVGHTFVLSPSAGAPPPASPKQSHLGISALPRGGWRETLPDTQPSHPSFPNGGQVHTLLSCPSLPFPSHALSFRLLTPTSALISFMGQVQVFITPGSLTPARFVCQPGFTGRAWKKKTKGLECL